MFFGVFNVTSTEFQSCNYGQFTKTQLRAALFLNQYYLVSAGYWSLPLHENQSVGRHLILVPNIKIANSRGWGGLEREGEI